MDKYQKIKDLGLDVAINIHGAHVSANDLLKVLDSGVEVYGFGDLFLKLKTPSCEETGLIINIKPLKPKEVTITREDLKTAFSDGFGIVDISYFDVIAKRLGL